MRAHQAGFTIIEVTLFLAISGLLLLVALIGTGSMAARQRFTDTTDSLQAYLQIQYDEVVNGVNSRGANTECSGSAIQAGMSTSCLLLGKILTVNGTTITSNYVISTAKLLGTETTDQSRLDHAQLKAVTADASTYELKWGGTAFNVTRSDSPRKTIDTIAFLRLPDSGRMIRLYYASSGGSQTASLQNAVKNDYPGAYDPTGSLPANPTAVVCVQNDTDMPIAKPRAAIFFDQGTNAGSIVTNYNPGSALCP